MLFEHYMRGLEYLFDVAPEFGRLAQILGIPEEGAPGETAQVEFTNGKIKFSISVDYVENLTDEEVAGIIAHETYHVVLEHLDEMMSGEYDVEFYLVEAHECIINDSIPLNFGITMPEGLYSGPVKFDQDFSVFTTRQGYDFVEDFYKDNENEEDESEEDSASDESDSASGRGGCGGIYITPEEVEAFHEFMDNELLEAGTDIDVDKLDSSIADRIEDLQDGDLQQTGVGFSIDPNNTDTHSFSASSPYYMNWAQLLKIIDPKIMDKGKVKKKPNWARPNRSYMSVYPDVILPSKNSNNKDGNRNGKNKPYVIIALDLSGSIPKELINHMVALADTLPQDIMTAVPVTWSDSVHEYYIDYQVVETGGTDFNNLVRWVQNYSKENKVDPYVICITDGGFSNYSVINNKQWIDSRWHMVGIDNRSSFQMETRFKNVYNIGNFIS